MFLRNPFTLVLCATFLGASLLPAEALGGNGLEGKWVMDAKKSPSANVAPAHLIQEIKINGDQVTVESRYDEPKNGIYPIFWVGLMTQKLQLSTDGSEVFNQVGPYAHKSKTTLEGNKMVTDWVAVNEPGQVQGQWIRTLSEDGKEMTMNLKGKSSDGRSIDATIVFVRK